MPSVLRKSSEKPILTSRDVYYFVAKSEQEYKEAKAESEQKTSRSHDNDQINTDPANNKSAFSDDNNFNDERDCELQSVMTYHDAVDDYRTHSAVDSEEKRRNEDLLLRDLENTAIDDIRETDLERQTSDEEIPGSPAEVEEQRDINPHRTDQNRDNLLQDNQSEEIAQDYTLQDEGVCQIDKEIAVFADKQDQRNSNDLVQRKSRIKSSKTGNGLPPRKTLVLLTTKGDPKKREKRKEMENAVKEILMRGENKMKELRVRVQNLRLESEELRDENRALKKLQRLQGKEVANMERFVSMTTATARDIKRDVREAEVSSFSIDTSLRRKNKKIRKLRRECERYEKLIDMDQKMPNVDELEERLDLAEKHLQDKDQRIETLNKKVKTQEKKRNKVRQKELKKFAQLEEEVRGTLHECEELKQRLKDAERKINKTNIYSRRSNATHNALPAPPTLPALPWHPPVSRQTTSTKVKNWLNDSSTK